MVHGRSHFLLRKPGQSKRKFEETKESVATDDFYDVKVGQLTQEIDDLKEKIHEYRMIQIEDAKYKRIVDTLVDKGIISESGEELMKF